LEKQTNKKNKKKLQIKMSRRARTQSARDKKMDQGTRPENSAASRSKAITINNNKGIAPLVLDAPVLDMPVDDVLLSDVTWDSLTSAFPDRLVHSLVKQGEECQFRALSTLRVLALLPVRTKTGSKWSAAKWVPFLVDTGSNATYFCASTKKALKMDVADNFEVLEFPLLFRESSGYFADINLLGTDVMRHCRLEINYTTSKVVLEKVGVTADVSFWVQQQHGSSSNNNNNKVGRAFKVAPQRKVVDDLAQAIKAELAPKYPTLAAPDISVQDSKHKKLLPDTPLQANRQENPYLFLLPDLQK